MIPPQLIVFAIVSLIRLSRAADKAAAQFARDRPIALPGLDLPVFSDDNRIKTEIDGAERKRVEADPDLGPLWKLYDEGQPGDPGYDDAKARLLMEATGIAARRSAGAPAQLGPGELGAAILVGQWREGAGPRSPLTGVALTLLDVGLEFVALEPSMLGVRKGERLIGAFAQNLALLIEPDKETQRSFAEEAFTTFLRASLTTLQENPDLVVSDKDWAKLVKNTLQPIIATLPTTVDNALHLRVRNLADLLLGPVFKAAVATIAESPSAFLGDAAKIDTLPGVVIAAILTEAKGNDLTAIFTEAGLAAFVRATLGAMAAHSELVFSASDPTKADRIAQEIVKQVLTTLSQKWQGTPFAGDLGLHLAAAALLGVKNGLGTLFQEAEPWQALAGKLLTVVIDGLVEGLQAGGADLAKSPLSADRMVEFGRIFLEQAAKTPAMIAGKNAELASLVKAVAQAMAKDKGKLLGHGDWLEIARVAAAEAAANPGRLFKLPSGAGGTLADAVLSALFRVAEREAAERREHGDAVLFGPTLRELIVHTISATAGNIARIADATGTRSIELLLDEILKQMRADPKRYGAKELLRVFKFFLAQVLATGTVPTLSDEKVVAALAGTGK